MARWMLCLVLSGLAAAGCSGPAGEPLGDRTGMDRREHRQQVDDEKLILAHRPKDAEAFLRLSALYRSRGDFGKAVAALRLGLKRVGHHRGLVAMLARTLLDEGDTAAAVRIYEGAVARDPAFTDALYALGEFAAGTGDVDRARGYFEKAGVFKQAGVRACMARASLHYLAKDYGKTMDELKAALRGSPRDAAATYAAALTSFTMGDMQAASAYITAFIRMRDDVPEGYYLDGRIALAKKDYRKCVASLRRAVDLDPAHTSAYMVMGDAYRVQKKFVPAARAYKDALADAPGDAFLLSKLAFVQRKAGRFTGAVTTLEKLLVLEPGDARAAEQLAYLCYLRKDYSRARTYFTKLLGVKGKEAAAHTGLGLLYDAAGETKRALGEMTKALAANPKYPYAHINAGILYRKMKQYGRAARAYATAIKLDPRAHAAYLNLGILYETYRNDKKKALKCYRQYVDMGGKDPRVRKWIAELSSEE